MKRIIRNKLYNTDTAHKIAEYCNNAEQDFARATITLYRKRTGEYFIHGDGGPYTIYGRRYEDGSMGWGEKIEPLTYQQAKQWAEDHISADAYESEFGKITEDDSTTVLYLNLPSAIAEQLRRSARENGKGITEYILSQLELASSISSGDSHK